MRPLLCLLVFLAGSVSVHAQMRSRLVGRIDSMQLDSVHYSYSNDRSAIFKTAPGLFPYTYRVDLYDSFAHYSMYTNAGPWHSGAKIYDSNDNVLVYRSYQTSLQPSMVYVYIDSCEYDANNNLVRQRTYGNNQLNVVPVLRDWTDNFYSGGLLIKSIAKINGKVGIWENSYNTNNQLVSSKGYDSTGTRLGYTASYGYNGNNQLVFEAHGVYDTTGTFLKDSTQTFYTYSGQQVTQILRQGFVVWIMTNMDKTDYIYANNLLMSRNDYTWSSGQWVLSGVDSSVYDSNNDRVLGIFSGLDNSGKVTGGGRYTYGYDADHNITYELRERLDTGTNAYVSVYLDSSTYDHMNQQVEFWQYTWNKDSSQWYKYESWYIHNYYEYFWPSGVAEKNKANTELLLYPSPAQSFISLKISANGKQSCKFAIMDIQGRVLRQWADEITGTEERNIPVNNLPDGTYILSMISGAEKVSRKFNIAH